MNGLDLFSGIGGMSLGLAEWVRTVAYCEIEPYAQGVLLSRMASGELHTAPIWDDVTTLHEHMLPESIDIITAGFPCQDVSVAGRGGGLEGERSSLVFDVFRLIDEAEPEFVFLENVPAIRTRGLDRILRELCARGYDCRWTCVDAAEVGASHIRSRWFLLAHNPGERVEGGWAEGEQVTFTLARAQVSHRPGEREREVEPDLRRSADDVSAWMDRLRCLGNAVVPLQAREAFKRLMYGG